MKLQRDKKALLHFNIAMDLSRDSKDYHTIKTYIERLHIRGVKDVDAEVASRRRSQGGAPSTRRPEHAHYPQSQAAEGGGAGAAGSGGVHHQVGVGSTAVGGQSGSQYSSGSG